MRKRLIAMLIAVLAIYAVSYYPVRSLYISSLGFAAESPYAHTAIALVYLPMIVLDESGWIRFLDEPDAIVGKIVELGTDRIAFDHGGGRTSAGFVCDPSACSQIGNVTLGDEAQAIFGSATVGGRKINKLVSLRRCEQVDAECEENRERNRRKQARNEADSKRWQDATKRCRSEMMLTVTSDGNYALPGNWTDQDVKSMSDKYDLLVEPAKTCANSAVSEYQNALYEACIKHSCGQMVLGGCSHIVGPIPIQAFARAVQKCGA